MLAIKYFLEAANRILNFYIFSCHTGENLGNSKWLRQKALNFTGPGNGDLVFFRKLVHAEDGNDIL